MADTFSYRPKFVDIRVKKAGAKASVNGPRPEEAATGRCDHVGCEKAGSHKAPKSREREGEFWNFCREHVTEYNRRWNYFSGMSDEELADYRRKEEIGHRPTWTFRGGRGDRIAAGGRAKPGQRNDAFGLFGAGGAASHAEANRPRKRITRVQGMALEVLQLDENADSAQIRARYAELVKRWHPDSNGGDRGAETNLQKVIKAYQALKSAGLV